MNHGSRDVPTIFRPGGTRASSPRFQPGEHERYKHKPRWGDGRYASHLSMISHCVSDDSRLPPPLQGFMDCFYLVPQVETWGYLPASLRFGTKRRIAKRMKIR